MQPFNTFFGLYVARETIFYQNEALEDIWVWDPCSKASQLTIEYEANVVRLEENVQYISLVKKLFEYIY